MSHLKRYKVRAHYKHYYSAEVEAVDGDEAVRKAIMEMNQEDFTDEGDGEWWVDDSDEGPEEIPEPQPSHWDDQPEHPVEDWRYEIANDDTRLGYLDWCAAREEMGHD